MRRAWARRLAVGTTEVAAARVDNGARRCEAGEGPGEAPGVPRRQLESSELPLGDERVGGQADLLQRDEIAEDNLSTWQLFARYRSDRVGPFGDESSG